MGRIVNALVSFTLGTTLGMQLSHHYLNKYRSTIENKNLNTAEKSGIIVTRFIEDTKDIINLLFK